MLSSGDCKAICLEKLRGHWGLAIGVGFVAAILGGTEGYHSGVDLNFNDNTDLQYHFGGGGFHSGGGYQDPNSFVPILQDSSYVLDTFMAVLFIIAIGWFLVVLAFGGAASMGYAQFNLDLIEGKPVSFGLLFSHFNRFLDGFLMNLLRSIFIFLWSLLLVIPGIIAMYRYAATPYLMVRYPHLTPSGAIDLSKQIMQGHKGRLFILHLSFIGWAILCALTLGIGLLFLTPYTHGAQAAFMKELLDADAGNMSGSTLNGGAATW